MWEVFSFGNRPYGEWTNRKVIENVEQGYRLPPPKVEFLPRAMYTFFQGTPTALHKLMLQCWEQERRNRPSFAHIVSMIAAFLRCPDAVYDTPDALLRSSSLM
jgi:hypothetical protein